MTHNFFSFRKLMLCVLTFACLECASQTWIAMGTFNGTIYKVLDYNNRLYAMGNYSVADSHTAMAIAVWDSVADQWKHVDNFSHLLRDAAVFNNDLCVAGDFIGINQTPVAHYVASYNGTSWSSLGTNGPNSHFVNSIAVYNGALYAGGSFTSAGIQGAKAIAKWDGSAWSAVGTGSMDPDASFFKLTNQNNTLYALGVFTAIGGVSVNNVAAWNGSSWSGVADFGGDNLVYDLKYFNGELFAGGTFTTVNGSAANHVAIFSGTTWVDASSGLGAGDIPATFGVFNNELYLSTRLLPANNGNIIYKWNGSSWVQLATSNGIVGCIGEHSGKMIVSGTFTQINGVSCSNIALFSSVSTGIKINVMVSGLHLQPNPCTDKALLRSDAALDGAEVTLYNSNGEAVKRFSQLTGHELIIERENLPAGIYLLRSSIGTGYTKLIFGAE